VSPASAGSGARNASPEQLARLAPLGRLSPERLTELSGISPLEYAPRGADPMQGRALQGKSVFLINGEMLLAFKKGGTLVVVGGDEETRRPLNRRDRELARTRAITDIDLLTLDDEVLDILATWDEVSASGQGEGATMARAMRSDARLVTGVFSISNLRSGVFAQLPPAHIEELLRSFERIKVKRGDVVVREGDEGDYYYVVESGRMGVERVVGGARMELAELKSGDAFGEEALVSEAKRNATVTASSDADLLRLNKEHFIRLLREPLLRRISFAEASRRVGEGALWLDVRYPSEYQYDKLPGAINVPLAEVRNMFSVLDRSKEYVVYCQSGRRSAAAAFLFAQHGFRMWVLDGGLWAAEKRR
jgi:rhodanese-related sulfurtransferase